jgi:hypothetical protein
LLSITLTIHHHSPLFDATKIELIMGQISDMQIILYSINKPNLWKCLKKTIVCREASIKAKRLINLVHRQTQTTHTDPLFVGWPGHQHRERACWLRSDASVFILLMEMNHVLLLLDIGWLVDRYMYAYDPSPHDHLSDRDSQQNGRVNKNQPSLKRPLEI